MLHGRVMKKQCKIAVGREDKSVSTDVNDVSPDQKLVWKMSKGLLTIIVISLNARIASNFNEQ